MRLFNDEGVSFHTASTWRDTVVDIDLSIVNLLSDQTKALLIDPPEGIYDVVGGYLPILESGPDYYVNLGNGLERVKDPLEHMFKGNNLYAYDGLILISGEEAKAIAPVVDRAMSLPQIRNISAIRMKARVIPILFVASFIHRQLMDQVLGNSVVFDHLFGSVYSGNSYGTQTLLGGEVKYGVRSIPTYKYFLKEELTRSQEERILMELEPAFIKIQERMPIGGLSLPTFTTVLTSKEIRLEFGLDIRVLSHILDREEMEAQQARKEIGED